MTVVDKQYQYWSRGLDKKYEAEGHAPLDACTRLVRDDYVKVAFSPKFKIAKNAKYFGIGSCFARNIETSLRDNGADVLSMDLELPEAAKESIFYFQNEIMTKFTTHSMETELKSAFSNLPLDQGFIQIKRPLVWNPQLHRGVQLPPNEQRATAKAVRDTVLKVADADVVFITLGLTETWIDIQTGTPLNDAPIDWRYAKKTGRFEFKNMTYEECKSSLLSALHIIRTNSKRDVKFVLTVSPVPLLRTFSDQDIIVANSYSKGVLRAVAQQLYTDYDDVDYFPSYEMVVNSPRHKAWRHDQRHVVPDQVWAITRQFRAAYIKA